MLLKQHFQCYYKSPGAGAGEPEQNIPNMSGTALNFLRDCNFDVEKTPLQTQSPVPFFHRRVNLNYTLMNCSISCEEMALRKSPYREPNA